MVVARTGPRTPQAAAGLEPIQWGMSGGRKTVPLFDLLPKKAGIEDRGRVGPATHPATITPATHPATTSAPTGAGHVAPHPTTQSQLEAKPTASTPPARPARSPDPQRGQAGQFGQRDEVEARPINAEPDASPDAIVVPRFAFAVIVASLAALLVLAWAAGVKFGHVQSEQSQAAKLQSEEGRLLGNPGPGPGTDGVGGGGTPDATPSKAGDTPQPLSPNPTSSPQGSNPGGGAAAGSIYTADGWTATDPRQKGMNYLRLATLNRDQALLTVDYLKQKGKRSVAVPSGTVDRSPGGGKNPTYFVYLLAPLSRDQYRDAALRTRIENEIKDIGKQWAKLKDRGPTDFAQPGWVKYE